MYDLGVVEFGRGPWMEEKKRLRKIMYGQMAAILSFTLMMYAPGIDLDIELGRIRYSQDALLKRRPQGEKTTVFNPNTTHKRVFCAVTQSYSVVCRTNTEYYIGGEWNSDSASEIAEFSHDIYLPGFSTQEIVVLAQ